MALSGIEKLIADPLAWVHPARVGIPAHWGRAVPRGIINSILAQQYALATMADLSGDCAFTRPLIEHWALVCESAWYMACQRHREELLQSDYLWKLDGKARGFMQLEIVTSVRSDNHHIDETLLWQRAYGEMTPLFALLPPGIARAIRLLFPPQVDGQAVLPASTPFDSVLFFMALQHARKYSATF